MKTKRLKKSNPLLKDAWQLYVMMAVPLLLVFIFNYLPMGGIIIAFKNYNYQDGIFGSEWCWFKNFEFFFKSSDFVNITWNTIYMNAIFISTGTLRLVALLQLVNISVIFVLAALEHFNVMQPVGLP